MIELIMLACVLIAIKRFNVHRKITKDVEEIQHLVQTVPHNLCCCGLLAEQHTSSGNHVFVSYVDYQIAIIIEGSHV